MNERSIERGNRAAWVLLVLGSLAMVGDALGLQWMKGLGVATVAAPLPKVFSDVDGFETFAADFVLEVEADGETTTRAISPEFYSALAGPYNRRNVYGAALAYAPRLPDPMWRSVFCYGFRDGGPLREEFGLPQNAETIRVRIATRTRGRDDSWVLEDPCAG